MPGVTQVNDQDTVVEKLMDLVSDRAFRFRNPFYAALDGVVLRCGPAIHDRRAALEGWQELSVSTGLPLQPDVVGSITFWGWEKVDGNTWDVCKLGETRKDGLLSFPLEGFEYGESFHLSASVATNGIHHIRTPLGDGKVIEVKTEGDDFFLVMDGGSDAKVVTRGADRRNFVRVATAEFTGIRLPAKYFELAASDKRDVEWHEVTDETGKISAKIGRPLENWVIRASVRRHLLDDPQFVRVEILNSARQLIARAFIGLYPDDDENRSKGELFLNVVVPQIDNAENSEVQRYSYCVERVQLSKLTASDRDAVELSLVATGHSLSRKALQRVIELLPSGDNA